MPSASGVKLLAATEYVVALTGLPSASSFAHLIWYPSAASTGVHETGRLVGVDVPNATSVGVGGVMATVTTFELSVTDSSGEVAFTPSFHCRP